jgi:hypothetical protein
VYMGECTGLSFSPDGMSLMIAYQDAGVLLQVTRKDGFPFHAKSLNIKYHKEPTINDNNNNNNDNNDDDNNNNDDGNNNNDDGNNNNDDGNAGGDDDTATISRTIP